MRRTVLATRLLHGLSLGSRLLVEVEAGLGAVAGVWLHVQLAQTFTAAILPMVMLVPSGFWRAFCTGC